MSTETVRELPEAGFQFILDDIDAQIQRGMSLLEAVQSISTLGNRIDLSLALDQLTAMQIALVELAPDLPVINKYQTLEQPHFTASRFFLAVWSYGRIYLCSTWPSSPPLSPDW